jgi:hypothetical protein
MADMALWMVGELDDRLWLIWLYGWLESLMIDYGCLWSLWLAGRILALWLDGDGELDDRLWLAG